MNSPNRTSPARLALYALAFVAVVVLGFRFGPALTAAVSLPILALIIVCPIMMFFMMRGMSNTPRP